MSSSSSWQTPLQGGDGGGSGGATTARAEFSVDPWSVAAARLPPGATSNELSVYLTRHIEQQRAADGCGGGATHPNAGGILPAAAAAQLPTAGNVVWSALSRLPPVNTAAAGSAATEESTSWRSESWRNLPREQPSRTKSHEPVYPPPKRSRWDPSPASTSSTPLPNQVKLEPAAASGEQNWAPMQAGGSTVNSTAAANNSGASVGESWRPAPPTKRTSSASFSVPSSAPQESAAVSAPIAVKQEAVVADEGSWHKPPDVRVKAEPVEAESAREPVIEPVQHALEPEPVRRMDVEAEQELLELAAPSCGAVNLSWEARLDAALLADAGLSAFPCTERPSRSRPGVRFRSALQPRVLLTKLRTSDVRRYYRNPFYRSVMVNQPVVVLERLCEADVFKHKRRGLVAKRAPPRLGKARKSIRPLDRAAAAAKRRRVDSRATVSQERSARRSRGRSYSPDDARRSYSPALLAHAGAAKQAREQKLEDLAKRKREKSMSKKARKTLIAKPPELSADFKFLQSVKPLPGMPIPKKQALMGHRPAYPVAFGESPWRTGAAVSSMGRQQQRPNESWRRSLLPSAGVQATRPGTHAHGLLPAPIGGPAAAAYSSPLDRQQAAGARRFEPRYSRPVRPGPAPPKTQPPHERPGLLGQPPDDESEAGTKRVSAWLKDSYDQDAPVATTSAPQAAAVDTVAVDTVELDPLAYVERLSADLEREEAEEAERLAAAAPPPAEQPAVQVGPVSSASNSNLPFQPMTTQVTPAQDQFDHAADYFLSSCVGESAVADNLSSIIAATAQRSSTAASPEKAVKTDDLEALRPLIAAVMDELTRNPEANPTETIARLAEGARLHASASRPSSAGTTAESVKSGGGGGGRRALLAEPSVACSSSSAGRAPLLATQPARDSGDSPKGVPPPSAREGLLGAAPEPEVEQSTMMLLDDEPTCSHAASTAAFGRNYTAGQLKSVIAVLLRDPTSALQRNGDMRSKAEQLVMVLGQMEIVEQLNGPPPSQDVLRPILDFVLQAADFGP